MAAEVYVLSFYLVLALGAFLGLAIYFYPKDPEKKEMEYELRKEVDAWKPHERSPKRVVYWEEKSIRQKSELVGQNSR